MYLAAWSVDSTNALTLTHQSIDRNRSDAQPPFDPIDLLDALDAAAQIVPTRIAARQISGQHESRGGTTPHNTHPCPTTVQRLSLHSALLAPAPARPLDLLSNDDTTTQTDFAFFPYRILPLQPAPRPAPDATPTPNPARRGKFEAAAAGIASLPSPIAHNGFGESSRAGRRHATRVVA